MPGHRRLPLGATNLVCRSRDESQAVGCRLTPIQCAENVRIQLETEMVRPSGRTLRSD